MDEKSKETTGQTPEEATEELTPEELDEVAGGGDKHHDWIQVDGF